MRDFSTMTPSGRRSASMSRLSPSILRKPGLVSTAAAFPLIIASPGIRSFFGSFVLVFLSFDIDRLSLFKKGPDAFAEFFRSAAQDLITVFHRHHGFGRTRTDP